MIARSQDASQYLYQHCNRCSHVTLCWQCSIFLWKWLLLNYLQQWMASEGLKRHFCHTHTRTQRDDYQPHAAWNVLSSASRFQDTASLVLTRVCVLSEEWSRLFYRLQCFWTIMKLCGSARCPAALLPSLWPRPWPGLRRVVLPCRGVSLSYSPEILLAVFRPASEC